MSNTNHYQERFWKELHQLRVHVYYLEIYYDKSEAINKAINIFLAITSSSSICGWAIWSRYNFIWAIIIAFSQLINAIKHFLPYRNRLKSIKSILFEFEELLTSSEMKWFDVAEGKLTKEEINRLQFTIRKKKNEIVQRHLGEESLPEKKHYFKRATDLAETYTNNFYNSED